MVDTAVDPTGEERRTQRSAPLHMVVRPLGRTVRDRGLKPALPKLSRS